MVSITGKIEGDFDPETNKFVISGQDESGQTNRFEFIVENPQEFLLWAAMVFHEKAANVGKLGEATIVQSMGVTAHRGVKPKDALLAFQFGLGAHGAELAVILPVFNISDRRLSAIKAHLDQIIVELKGGTPARPQ